MDEFDIYLRGFVARAAEAPEVGLERVFGLDHARARELIRSLPRVVKRQLPEASALRYESALRELGADFELRRSPIRPAQIIAVSGTDAHAEAAALEQHGSTLSLTLPNPEPVRQHHASRMAARGEAQRFAQTMVGSAEQLSARVLDGSASTEDFADGADEVVSDPILPEHARAHVHAGHTTGADAPRALPSLASLPPLEAPQPVPSAAEPNAPNPWAAIEPSPAQPASGAGELPQPWEVPGLRLDGRPAWLVDGPGAHQAVELASEVHATSDPGGLQPIMSEPAPSTNAAARAQARASRAPATTPHSVGNVIGRELGYEPSMTLRIALRVGLGVSLFVIVLAVRHLHVFDRQLERELTRFGDSADEPTPARSDSNDAPLATGPEAMSWLEPDLHQFTNGDKDRVRSLIQRFNVAGALAVRVGHITRSGMVQIAGELIVELPAESDKRRAVLGEYQRFLQGTFGELAGSAKDPGGGTLHVAL